MYEGRKVRDFEKVKIPVIRIGVKNLYFSKL